MSINTSKSSRLAKALAVAVISLGLAFGAATPASAGGSKWAYPSGATQMWCNTSLIIVKQQLKARGEVIQDSGACTWKQSSQNYQGWIKYKY